MKNWFKSISDMLFKRTPLQEETTPVSQNMPEQEAEGDYLLLATRLLKNQGFDDINTSQASDAFSLTYALTRGCSVGIRARDMGKISRDGKTAFLVSLVIPSGTTTLDDAFVVAIPHATCGNDSIAPFPACLRLKDFVDHLGTNSVEAFFEKLPRQEIKKLYASIKRETLDI